MHIPILNRPSCLLKRKPSEPQLNTIEQYNSISPFSFSINHVETFYFYAFIHFSNRSYQCFSRRYANVIYCHPTYEATTLRGLSFGQRSIKKMYTEIHSKIFDLFHYPKHQNCATALLNKMERNRLIPDEETGAKNKSFP